MTTIRSLLLAKRRSKRHRVALVYRSWQDERTNVTSIRMALSTPKATGIQPGYCHLRQDLRTFRLDRIESITQRDEAFDDPGTV
jgi:predicted DNA-binding transcriptional regulator YafY